MEDNLKSPNFISSRIDVKGETLKTFSVVLETLKNPSSEFKLSNDTSLILLTSIGSVSGELVDIGNKPEGDCGDIRDKILSQIELSFVQGRNNHLYNLNESMNLKTLVTNNVSFIALKNAKVISPNNNITQHFERLYLFTDQILGFSFGVINE